MLNHTDISLGPLGFVILFTILWTTHCAIPSYRDFWRRHLGGNLRLLRVIVLPVSEGRFGGGDMIDLI